MRTADNPMVTGYGYYEPEPVRFDTCSECGETIYEGDTYYLLCGNPICEDCIEKGKRRA